MKQKWKLVELKRFDRIMLQISKYDLELSNYETVGTISIHETDLESRDEWHKAIEIMNLENENSQKSS